MNKFVFLGMFLISCSSLADEAYVSCRQSSWAPHSQLNRVYSLKTISCVRVEKSFWEFQGLEEKGREYCQNWQADEGLKKIKAQLFADQISCTQDLRNFIKEEIHPQRAVRTSQVITSEYLIFQDPKTPFYDHEAGRERARWVELEDQWYCSLPGQSFYTRYESVNGQHLLYVVGLGAGTEVFELKTSLRDGLLWRNLDSRSIFSQIENTLYMSGHNAFTVMDFRGSSLQTFRMTYLFDRYRDPADSCY